MTTDEAIKILAILRVAYPMYYNKMTEDAAENTANLWGEMLADMDYKLTAAAIKTYIATSTSHFPPVIGEINELIRTITNKEQLSPLEAVRLIKKAASNSLYNAQSEFEKLPPVLKKLVGNPSQLRAWAEMDADRLESYVSNNIIKEYNAITKKEDIKNTIPENVRALMGDFSNNFRLEDKQNN